MVCLVAPVTNNSDVQDSQKIPGGEGWIAHLAEGLEDGRDAPEHGAGDVDAKVDGNHVPRGHRAGGGALGALAPLQLTGQSVRAVEQPHQGLQVARASHHAHLRRRSTQILLYK
eukprot:9481507-Pyramimonas_sp.AAC.1